MQQNFSQHTTDMCDNTRNNPRIYFRWCRTVATKSSTVLLIPSYLKRRPIVLSWDSKRLLYISSDIRTPCGRHSAHVLIDGELYPCDNFSVNIFMFEVSIYIKDLSSDEDVFPLLKPFKTQEDIYKHIKLARSRDSGIQDMNSDFGKNPMANENTLENNFACVDEILDGMGSPVFFEKDANVSLNRSQSLGSCLNRISEQRTSTPIHRSLEKIVVMMPENFDCDFGKKKYFKKSIEIERNLKRSFTRVEKSVAVVKNDREICRGSEQITKFGPDSVDMQSLSNVLTVELKDEESQTGDDWEDLKKTSDEEESEKDFEKELSEENIELPEDESEQVSRECDLIKEENNDEDKITENVCNFNKDDEIADENVCNFNKDDEITENVCNLNQDDEITIENDRKTTPDVDENLLVSEGLNNSPVIAENENCETENVDGASNDGKESLESIQERISAHEQHVRQLEDEISLLDESREHLQTENEELLEKKLFLANQLGEDQVVLAKEVEELKGQVEQQEKANNALEWEVQELRNRLDSNDPGEVVQLLEEMKVLRDELITLTSKNKDLYGEIVELREENTSLKKQSGNETCKFRPPSSRKKEDWSSSDATEYPEFPVEMLGRNSRSLGVQTCLRSLEKEKRRRKTKRKAVKKGRRDRDDDSYSSGSSTDFLLEKADDVLRKSMEELLDVDCEDCKKQHKVTKFGHSAINIKRPTADVSISCRSFAKYSSPFIPKSIFDLNRGLPIKFMHPLTSCVGEGIVQSISNDKFECVQVRLNDSFAVKDKSSFCEDNEIISVPLRKVILAWR